MGVFVAIIFYIIFKSVRKLAAIVVFLQGSMDIILIPLVNVFGASAGFAIDQINHNIQNDLADRTGLFTFGKEHCDI